jgi:transposase InsO family protein
LSKALQTGHVPFIHHSDQGVQYKADSYDSRLLGLDVKISMAGKGRAWENPFAESVINGFIVIFHRIIDMRNDTRERIYRKETQVIFGFTYFA